MHYLDLRPGVSFGFVGNEIIFLDLAQDRYFALRGEAAASFRQLAEGPEQPLPEEASKRLLATGLLITAKTASSLSPAPRHIPRRSLADEIEPAGPFHLPTLVEIIASLVPIRRAIARGKVPARLRRITCLRGRARASEMAGDTVHHALRFAAARPLAPVAPSCLPDSLALAEYLLRRNCMVDIVFAVKLVPFAAHAWVQTGDLILNDSADRVGEFTPVLVA